MFAAIASIVAVARFLSMHCKGSNRGSFPVTEVEVKGVAKVYDNGLEALRNVNLSFPKGQLSTLLGPSGCGKTTLLKIIAGLLPRSGGEVLVKGKPVNGPGPERAFVFQDFALLPWASVLRNVGFGLELRGVARPEREELARKYIAEVGLKGFEDRYPNQLSGGMRQRVGLARALTVDADIILMDEPFSSVDEQTRRKFQEDLLDLLRHHHKTVIFVTHSIEEAAYLSDQIALLSPRPGTVSRIVRPEIDRSKSADEIRRDRNYLDTVDEIWGILRQYV
ncbi:MAG TPA: ABC transporter ATP-binding protein, partial [Burkholderiales bacterium]|nr:ABC transporter ATP-binding protein [Burkholderiales bacterium]